MLFQFCFINASQDGVDVRHLGLRLGVGVAFVIFKALAHIRQQAHNVSHSFGVDLDTFTIMTFPSSTGSFAAASFPALGGDLVWKIHHNPTSIVLEVLADLDGDGVRNASDCVPTDPTVWAAPAEVPDAGFAAGGQSFTWTSLAAQAGPATTYDVVRGLISELPVGGGASETCLGSGSTTNQVPDATTPALNTVLYYLVRGVNVCGTGTYGATSGGTERITAACP